MAGPGWRCPACGWEPAAAGGFLSFAPDLEAAAPSYPAGYHDEIHALEAKHFWFIGRNRLILWAMAERFPSMGRFLEIGCGTGFVLQAVRAARPECEITGSEASVSGLAHTARRVEGAALYQMDALRIPFRDHFDLIGAFDVIEHIEDDEAALGEMHRALKPGGGVLITVPQHPWLWSPVDVFAGHFRRYKRKDLVRKLDAAGFEVVMATSFISSLLPAMALSRMLKRGGEDPKPELEASRLQNLLGGAAFSLDRLLIRLGLRLPAGGSLLVAARRKA